MVFNKSNNFVISRSYIDNHLIELTDNVSSWELILIINNKNFKNSIRK